MTIVVSTTTVASSYNFNTLVERIIAWSHRADLEDKMQEFIELAEMEIFRELTMRSIEASAAGTTEGGAIPLPDSVSAIERVEIEANGHRYTLNYTSPNGIETLTGSTDRPTRIVVENGEIRLIPAPSGPYAYTVYYIPVLAALTASNPTNWLLVNHADVYLKGVMRQLSMYTKNAADAQFYSQELGIALNSVGRLEERKRFPIAGGLQIKPRSVR